MDWRERLRFCGQLAGEDFDCHLFVGEFVSGAINFPHPAFAEERIYYVTFIEFLVDHDYLRQWSGYL